jgi:hypothetical protein
MEIVSSSAVPTSDVAFVNVGNSDGLPVECDGTSFREMEHFLEGVIQKSATVNRLEMAESAVVDGERLHPHKMVLNLESSRRNFRNLVRPKRPTRNRPDLKEERSIVRQNSLNLTEYLIEPIQIFRIDPIVIIAIVFDTDIVRRAGGDDVDALLLDSSLHEFEAVAVQDRLLNSTRLSGFRAERSYEFQTVVASKQDVPVVNETAIEVRFSVISDAEYITKRKFRLCHGDPADRRDEIVNPVNKTNWCYPDTAD